MRRSARAIEILERRVLLDATVVGGLPTLPDNSLPNSLTVVGDRMFFTADAGGFGRELLVTDGTPQGTRLVKDINPGAGSSNPTQLTDGGNLLYFTVPGPNNTSKLWRSDGTAAGTYPLDTSLTEIDSVFPLGGILYFGGRGPSNDTELWKSDGTPVGTMEIKQVNHVSSFLGPFTAVNGTVLFIAQDDNHHLNVWRSDGIADGTDIISTGPSSVAGYPPAFVTLGNEVYFLFFDQSPPDYRITQVELWRSDATATGTGPVATFAANNATLASFQGSLFLTVGRQLIRSDGTSATTLIHDFSGNDAVSILSPVNGRLLLAVSQQLWATDGTAAGTMLLDPTASVYDFRGSIDSGTAFYFSSNALRVTDGTPEGTMPLKTFTSFSGLQLTTNGGPLPSRAVFQHKLFFVADDGQHGFELWQSDGTPAGTTLFDDLSPGVVNASAPLPGATILPFPGDGPPDQLTADNGKLFFTEPMYLWHSDLWVTDPGSNTATDIYAINGGGQDAVFDLTAVGNRVFFERSVGDGLVDELGVTDGTAAGTKILGMFPRFTIHDLNGNAVFGGNFIGISDGTAAGTIQLQLGMNLDFNQPSQPIISGSNAFFVTREAPSAGNRGALWRTDGTLAGTIQLTPPGADSYVSGVQPIAGGVRFLVHDNASGTDTLWVSDGTAPGTHPATMPPPPTTPPGVVYNGLTYYAADDGIHGTELFSTDGTAAGAKLVADINPGPGSSNPTSLTVARGLLYFNAYRSDVGNELWVTDGTGAGTHLVQDLMPGPGSSNPQEVTDVSGTLYFVASDPLHRNALWKLPVGGPPNVRLDFSYLLNLAQHYGKQGTFSAGDLNDDGTVGFDDLLLLVQNYGQPLQARAKRSRLPRNLARN